jgi:site-specific recombinase XerC
MTRAVKPRSVHTYHGHLKTLFRWMIEEGIMEASPMETIAAPIARTDQVQPFDERQISGLLSVAQKTLHGRRDYAIVCLCWIPAFGHRSFAL